MLGEPPVQLPGICLLPPTVPAAVPTAGLCVHWTFRLGELSQHSQLVCEGVGTLLCGERRESSVQDLPGCYS